MKRVLTRRIIPVGALSFTLLVLMSIFASSALAFPTKGYDIEVQMVHCIDQSKPCNTFQTASNSLYTQVETISFKPGVRESTPDAVIFACGRAYTDAKGNPHIVSEHVFTGPQFTHSPFDKGWIKGEAELIGNPPPTESSTWAKAHIQYVRAYDEVTKDWGMAWGTLVTNNTNNHRISGGFHLWMYGPITDETLDTQGNTISVKHLGVGEMNCDSTASYTPAPFATGPTFRAVLGSTE